MVKISDWECGIKQVMKETKNLRKNIFQYAVIIIKIIYQLLVVEFEIQR